MDLAKQYGGRVDQRQRSTVGAGVVWVSGNRGEDAVWPLNEAKIAVWQTNQKRAAACGHGPPAPPLYILYHIPGPLSIGKMHKIPGRDLCKVHNRQNAQNFNVIFVENDESSKCTKNWGAICANRHCAK